MVEDISITDWTEKFKAIYGENDKEKNIEQIWIALSAHCSAIGESIRKYDFTELLDEAAHSFCWMCTYINKCNSLEDSVFGFSESLSDIISFKYPVVCGHCHISPCRCEPKIMDGGKDKAAGYRRLLNAKLTCENDEHIKFERYTIQNWQSVFDKIYGQTTYMLSVENIGFHFLEEVGEEAKAIRELSQLAGVIEEIDEIDMDFINRLSTIEGIVDAYEKFIKKDDKIDYTSLDPDMITKRLIKAKMDMIVEMADIFSWYCSILNKIRGIIDTNKFKLLSLEDVLNDCYKYDGEFACVSCNKKLCECKFFPKNIEMAE